jgi:hypothetical protein
MAGFADVLALTGVWLGGRRARGRPGGVGGHAGSGRPALGQAAQPAIRGVAGRPALGAPGRHGVER